MENRLQFETSPYLLQHKDNPVAWQAWTAEAFEAARSLDRPVLLSIGYAACHWCHVMAHESFEDAETAAVMNRLFVNIKVDREERPDIDQIYMSALQAMGDTGGWPLTMFLDGDGRPFWGGTYLPKTARFGRPAFTHVLGEIARLYRDERGQIREFTGRLAHRLAPPAPKRGPALDAHLLDRAAEAVLGIMDPVAGGTRGAPRFPNFPVLDFLGRSAERTGRGDLRHIVETTLRSLSLGGIFDQFGGGLARYSTDERWLVPHFEKMLSDNGQFLERLAAAAAGSGDALFRSRIERTVGWLLREMRTEDGLAASLDADSEGVEGRFYVWDAGEVERVLGPADAATIARRYDITRAGNWEGVSIPNRLRDPDSDEVEPVELLERLRAARDLRPRPSRDDKILADWNGRAIAGLALAGFLLRRDDWITEAERVYRIVLERLGKGDRLGHSWCDGKLVFPGFSTDYAALVHAGLMLHQATADRRFLADAERFSAALARHHGDGQGGYHFTADDAESLIIRPSSRLDDATPNAHAEMAGNLVRLWMLTGRDAWRAAADAIFESAAAAMAENVFGTASLLAALDLRLRARGVVLIVPEGGDATPLVDALRADWRSTIILDVHGGEANLPADHPAHGKTAIGGRPTAYLCREGLCSAPVTGAEELAALIAAA